MASEETKTMLCIPAGSRKYAVEFTDIEEICRDLKLSRIPCMPGHFAGVCNYKGTVTPVVYLEGTGREKDAKHIILILNHEKYHAGILIYQEPYLVNITDEDLIRGPGQPGEGLWQEKAYYMGGGTLYTLIDVDKSLEKLVVYR